jgi:hypothetical protein
MLPPLPHAIHDEILCHHIRPVAQGAHQLQDIRGAPPAEHTIEHHERVPDWAVHTEHLHEWGGTGMPCTTERVSRERGF